MRVTSLRCEYAVNPLGVDVARPRLSWCVESGERGQRQTAYQVTVLSTSSETLWDSGRIESSDTAHVRYAGPPLAPSRQVSWKVRAWDREGAGTEWSETATWTMGLLDPSDWKGIWIAAPAETEALLLRRDVPIKPQLRRAIVHVSGLGQYELSVNGRKVGDDLLAPGWTNYDRTILYDTHDVTSLLQDGANALGLTLGNGMYHVVRRNRFAKFTGSFGPLRAIVHLRLEYADGSVDFIGTDETWRTHPGAITFNSIYGGEDHDARLELGGWGKAGFNARDWRPAVAVVRPAGALRGHCASAEPVQTIETREPVAVRELSDGTSVYDFGQNASFMPRLRVSGPAGATVRLTPAEVVNDDGTINRNTMGNPSRGLSWWQYTKGTNEPETWSPKFFYVGSRYIHSHVDGAKIDALDMTVVHSSAAPVGHFECSDDTLNRIHDLIRWAQRSNMVSILTDCPHREKLGWIEQNHLNGPSLRYAFDVSRLFAKNVRDMAEAQTPEGLIPNIAPAYTKFEGTFRAAAEWGAAFIAVPWQQYQFTGDAELLHTHYDAMKRYFAYLESRAADDVLHEGLGDWYDLGPNKPGRAQLTPPPVTATAMFYQDALLLSQIATVLKQSKDAADYADRAARIRASYNRRFFDAATGVYGTGSQSSLAIPLALGIVDAANRQQVVAALVRRLEEKDFGTTCGNVGFRFLIRALADGGRSDVIYRMLVQDEKPGYAYQLKRGETSLCESWDANLGSSHNHFMFGQAMEWFYHDLAGIQPDPAGPGFAKIIIRPQPVREVEWVEARYASIRGLIRSRWERRGDQLKLDVTIPANTTAAVWLPWRADEPIAVESGRHVFEGAMTT